MSITVFTSAFLIDCTGGEPVEGAAVVVEDDRIKDVVRHGNVGALPGPVTTLDCKGATLMPGLTDAHVHICAVTENITDQHRAYPASYIAARAMRRAEECLLQGFTTARDAGGADYGFRLALEEATFRGRGCSSRATTSRRPVATATSAGGPNGSTRSAAASA